MHGREVRSAGCTSESVSRKGREGLAKVAKVALPAKAEERDGLGGEVDGEGELAVVDVAPEG